MQLPFNIFLPDSDWKPPRIEDLPSWENAKRVGYDIETSDVYLKDLGPGVRRGGYIVGISFCIEDHKPYYLPLRHEGGGNVNVEKGLAYFRRQAQCFRGKLVGANLGYDLDYSAEAGIEFKQVAQICDIQVAEPLINEHRFQYNLNAQSKIYNLPAKDQGLLKLAAQAFGIHEKSQLWRLHSRFVGPYAEWDAELPLKIFRKQERILDEQNLWDAFNLESALLPVLVRMRRRGIAINETRLEMFTEEVDRQMVDICKQISQRSRMNIFPSDLKKAAILGPLIESLGYRVPRTEKAGDFSVKKDYLATLDHPVAKLLNEARSYSTLKGFCKGLPRYIINGRIHPTINQLKTDREDGSGTKGTVSFRCSSDNPNGQQQPIRHPTMGPLWRGIYKPDGELWCSSDYSQQEPRLTVHFAEKTHRSGASLAGDRYRSNPDEDSHAMMAEMTGLERKPAKAVFLGVCYNMGGAKLCDELGLPTAIRKIKGRNVRVAGPEGQAILNQFDERVPFVRQLAQLVESKAATVGFIRTISGHVVHFPPDELGNFQFTHKALNRLIQGSAAGQMKQAMVDADRAGINLQLQVHDEVDFSPSSMQEAKDLAQIMTDAVPLTVPVKVDLEVGPSWGEIDEKGRVMCKEFYGNA